MSEAQKMPSRPDKGRRDQGILMEFSFNRAVKVKTATSDVSTNSGVLLVRDADDRLGVTRDIAAALHDDRDMVKIRYPMAVLLRGIAYAMGLGFAQQDDADFLAHDPAFRAAVWDKPGSAVADERLASQPSASRLVALLADERNRETFRSTFSLPLLRHQQANGGEPRVKHGVADIDGFTIKTYGDQPGAVYNGYYGQKVYSPLAAYFSVGGDFNSRRLGEGFLHAHLRDGNAPPAGEAEAFIDEVVRKAQDLAQTVTLRMDAGFAGADILNRVDRAGVRFLVRLPDNAILQQLARPYLNRPQGRPPKEGYEHVVELDGYRNSKWDKSYRVILVVVDKPMNGQLLLAPNYFFIVTNWPKNSRSPAECLACYRQRGTFEDRIGEWKAMGVKLSLNDFAKNEATLLLSMLAFNLMEVIRSEAESASDPRVNPPHSPEGSGMDMGRMRNVLLKTGSVLSRSGRRLWFSLAEGVGPLWRAIQARFNRWHSLLSAIPVLHHTGYVPPPAHAFLSYTPRL